MKIGDTITIIPSVALWSMRMGELSGTDATITNIVKKGEREVGCWVRLRKKFLGKREWFIPYSSVGIWN